MLSFITASTLYGPLHTKQAVEQYQNAIQQALQQGGTVVCGGKVRWQIELHTRTTLEMHSHRKVQKQLFYNLGGED